jgi:hypothetical protein
MEKDKEIQESSIERFLESHKKEIIDSIMDKIFKDTPQVIKMTGEIYDRLVNELMKDVPFGSMIQLSLANALIYSLLCGQRSRILMKDEGLGFNE